MSCEEEERRREERAVHPAFRDRERGHIPADVPSASAGSYLTCVVMDLSVGGCAVLLEATRHIQAAEFPDRILLCDRGTADGGAYWPDGSTDFFESVGTTQADELARYDAVIFFETAAKGGHGFESENRFRT